MLHNAQLCSPDIVKQPEMWSQMDLDMKTTLHQLGGSVIVKFVHCLLIHIAPFRKSIIIIADVDCDRHRERPSADSYPQSLK